MNKLLPFNMPPISKGGMLGMLAGAGGGAGGLGLYQELGRTALTGTSDTISVSLSTAKPYLMVLCNYITGSSNVDGRMFFNSDGGSGGSSNYAWRIERDGNTASTTTSTYGINTEESYFNNAFQYYFINNFSDYEKLVTGINGHDLSSGAASVAPTRCLTVGKWITTGSQITTVATTNIDSGDYASGSEMVVLGYDPTDTVGTSIWEELASVELTGASDTIDSGTIANKKYLWIEYFINASGSAGANMRFNSNSSSVYSTRRTANGGSDDTYVNQDKIECRVEYGNAFGSGFIGNNDGQQKLLILNETAQSTAGAGTAPAANQVWGKSSVTTNITSIQIVNDGGGDFVAGSYLKVWGFN